MFLHRFAPKFSLVQDNNQARQYNLGCILSVLSQIIMTTKAHISFGLPMSQQYLPLIAQ
jgi:hypothetical protein